MKNILSILAIVGSGIVAQAQPFDPAVPADKTGDYVNKDWKPSLVSDGVIDYVPKKAYVAPWQTIRANDVLYKKRVWRQIDVRQKQNMPFRYAGDENTGGGTFIEILIHGIKKGEIRAFSAMDDRFTTVLSYDDVNAKLVGKPETVAVLQPDGTYLDKITQNDFTPSNVTKFNIKEDVIFDRNLGREVRRIIGISPVIDRFNEDGTFRNVLPLFWVYYPECRNFLAKYDVYNPENDMFRMNWDDLFERRMFSSFITKTSINNPEQDDINQYKSNLDRLYESNKSNEFLFNKEHDLWVY
jgi:gliding motility associated protien GldN